MCRTTYSCRADVSDDAGWIAYNKRVIGHIMRDDRSRPDHCPTPDGYACDDDDPRAEGRAVADQRVPNHPILCAFQGAIWVNGTREPVVGKDDVWTDEHAILKLEPVVE